MNERQRDSILKNFKECCFKPNTNDLIERLIEKGINEKVLRENFTNEENHNKICLYFNLMKLSGAYGKLLECLREMNCEDLISKLKGNRGCEVIRFPGPYDNPEDPNNIDNPEINEAGLQLINIQVNISNKFKDCKEHTRNEFYRTRSKKRGTVLIINNSEFSDTEINGSRMPFKDRPGSLADVKNLENLFKQMGGYIVRVEKNQTKTQMENVIKDFAKYDHKQMADICFVIIMSHGYHVNDTWIFGTDHQKLEASWIVEQFYNEKCKPLLGKPKIFLFQVCRGSDLDLPISAEERTQTDGEQIPKIYRTASDILIAYPTIKGCTAHRDVYKGTWFIHQICQVCMESAHTRSVEEILKEVDRRLSTIQSESTNNSMQTVHFENISFKDCFLNPGIFEQNGQLCRF